jgi:hypothetical protein
MHANESKHNISPSIHSKWQFNPQIRPTVDFFGYCHFRMSLYIPLLSENQSSSVNARIRFGQGVSFQVDCEPWTVWQCCKGRSCTMLYSDRGRLLSEPLLSFTDFDLKKTSHDSEQTASFLSLWCKLKESDRLTQAKAAKRWKRRSSLRSSKYRSRKSFSTLCRWFSCEAEFRWTFATLPKCHRETSHCLFKHDQALSETNSHSI